MLVSEKLQALGLCSGIATAKRKNEPAAQENRITSYTRDNSRDYFLSSRRNESPLKRPSLPIRFADVLYGLS